MPTNDYEGGAGAVAWLRRMWRPLVSEMVATALLVLLGVASMLPSKGHAAPLTHPAIAFGLVVLANVEAFGPVSGAHMNPSVTLAAVLYRQMALFTGIAYVLAQMVGAIIGFGVLLALSKAAESSGGNTSDIPLVAAVTEAVLTGLLALLCCALWRAHEEGKQDPAVSIKFGLTVAGLIYAGGEISGASLNPARSFAPALLQSLVTGSSGAWKGHWAYWIGPLGGSALATLLYRFVLRPQRPAPSTTPEDLPLNDKRDPA